MKKSCLITILELVHCVASITLLSSVSYSTNTSSETLGRAVSYILESFLVKGQSNILITSTGNISQQENINRIQRYIHDTVATRTVTARWEHLCDNLDQFILLDQMGGFIFLTDNISTTCTFDSRCPLHESFMWNVQAPFLYIVTSTVVNIEGAVKENIRKCWEDHNVLNVVVMYLHGLCLTGDFMNTPSLEADKCIAARIFTYNPFRQTNKLYEFSQELIVKGAYRMYKDKLLNVHGHPIKVSLKENEPLTFINVTEVGQPIYGGPDPMIMLAILSQMNATAIFRPPERNLDGLSFPYDFVDEYEINKEDFQGGVPDIEGNSRALFLSGVGTVTYPHDSVCYTVVSPKAERMPGYMSFILPFKIITWALIASTLVLFVFSRKFMLHFQIDELVVETSSSTLLESLRLLVEGAIISPSQFFPGRFYLVTCSIFSLIITNSYQGCITSYLTTPKYFPEINTLQEWAESGLRMSILDNTFTKRQHKNVMAFDDEIMLKIIRSSVFVSDEYHALDNIVLYRNVTLATHLFYAIYYANDPVYQRDGQFLLHILKECFTVTPISFRLPENSPLSGRFNILIGRLVEAGLVKRWKDEVILKFSSITLKKQHSSFMVTLEMNHMQPVFYILLIGIAISILSFIVEILVSPFCAWLRHSITQRRDSVA